jgi:hypothetical protein
VAVVVRSISFPFSKSMSLTFGNSFWINLPFGGVALATVFFFFTNPPGQHVNMSTKEKLKQIDMLGAFFLICAIVCLLLALQWGGSTYPWHDSRVWGCLLGFGLIISVFIALQLYLKDRATLPPRILGRNRTVAACALFSAFLAMALYTHIYYLVSLNALAVCVRGADRDDKTKPFYFQAVKGTTAEGSGIRCIPYLVSVTVSSIVIGGAITLFGYYNPPMWLGICIFAVGSGMLYSLKVSSSTGVWIGAVQSLIDFHLDPQNADGDGQATNSLPALEQAPASKSPSSPCKSS